jgi:hypothetical protein
MGIDLVECCGCRCGCGLEGCVVASGGWIVVGGKRWITVGKTIGWPVEKAGLRGGFLVDYGGRFDLRWVGVGCGVIVGGLWGGSRWWWWVLVDSGAAAGGLCLLFITNKNKNNNNN